MNPPGLDASTSSGLNTKALLGTIGVFILLILLYTCYRFCSHRWRTALVSQRVPDDLRNDILLASGVEDEATSKPELWEALIAVGGRGNNGVAWNEMKPIATKLFYIQPANHRLTRLQPVESIAEPDHPNTEPNAMQIFIMISMPVPRSEANQDSTEKIQEYQIGLTSVPCKVRDEQAVEASTFLPEWNRRPGVVQSRTGSSTSFRLHPSHLVLQPSGISFIH